jgi:hypothetical protein
VVPDALEEPMTEVQDDSGWDSALVRNLAALAADLLERAAAAPAGRAALTLAAGAGAPLKQTMLALRSGEHLAEHEARAPPPCRSCAAASGWWRTVSAGSWARATTSRSRPPGTGWRAWRMLPSC